MILRFACPSCDTPDRVDLSTSRPWQCRACSHAVPLNVPDLSVGKPLTACVACGNRQLYRQKNFPQWLGLLILTFACAAFFILSGLYMRNLAWAVLLGSAAFDGLLYLFVGDALVCYRCLARHSGLPRNKAYEVFELATAEKYRQERLRRELAAKK
ncbi:MAG: hypothetical protein ACJ8F7_18550 [Gemmataceae bacterium]